jgi:hypothetical protein
MARLAQAKFRAESQYFAGLRAGSHRFARGTLRAVMSFLRVTGAQHTLALWTVVACALGAASACSSEDSSPGNQTQTTGGQTQSGGGTATGGEAPTGGATSGGTGGTTSGGAGGTASGGTGGTTDPNAPPQLLSQTGLYQADMTTLAAGVEEFTPQFALWSDGAEKHRWFSLPADATIDTTDMDFWTYPVGTKLWKEFTRDGVRVETRLLEKRPNGTWWMMAYQWNEAQTDAEARPAGLKDASGTQHDIPSQDECSACHGKMKDVSLGFTAIQLSHTGSGLKLTDLISRGALSAPPAGAFTVPGTDTDKAALGYLHANCGICHNKQSPLINARTNMQLWLLTDQLGSVEVTPAYTTAVNKPVSPTFEAAPGTTNRITAGDTATSGVFVRMNNRGGVYQMPPLGSEVVDTTGVAAIEAWINGLQ